MIRAVTSTQPASATMARYRVLVVDDEADVRTYLMKRLVESGYEDVVGAATLESALQLAQQMGRSGAMFLAERYWQRVTAIRALGDDFWAFHRAAFARAAEKRSE